MLDNTITLPVDVLGNSTLVNEVYNRFDEMPNRSQYIGADHTLSLRNQINFYRTLPKKSGNFLGVGKSEAKVTQDYVVPGADATTSVTAPGIVDVSCSMPVGMSSAQIMHLRQRAIAILDHAIAVRLTESLEY